MASVVDELEKVNAFLDYSLEAEAGAGAEAAGKVEAEPSKTEAVQQHQEVKRENRERVFASPAAKKTAQELEINLFEVKGSGPNQRILKQDVEEHKSNTIGSFNFNIRYFRVGYY